jgi:hypothetical protein
MKKLTPFLFLFLTLPLAAQAPAAAPVAASSAAFQYDGRATDIARLMAGLSPESHDFDHLLSTPAWKTQQSFFRSNWARMKKDRLSVAAKWRDEELNPVVPSTGPLTYPFSGPDFLNAYLFFPDRDDYVFYSLEKPGEWPPLETMTPDEFGQLLSDVRDSLGDIFRRQYFITKNMMTELKTTHLKGNLPVLGVFMALMDLKIVSVENVHLSGAGNVEKFAAETGGTKPIRGVRVTFRDPAKQKPQTLTYFSVDVSNKNLAKRPGFETYVRKLGPAPVFIKSASYLLHDPDFTSLRKILLDTASAVMQDDTGLPYRFINKGWDVKLYGRYTKPIKDFKFGFQEDLDKAYAVPGAAKPLPFKFGYHWWDGYSNLIIAVKKNDAPQQ